MPPLLENNLSQVIALCRKYGVKCMEAFGSLARGDFNSASSDVDLLVLFENAPARDKVDQFFGLLKELENLFGRKVDLVDITAARNPYFVADALRCRVRLYAA